MTIIDAHLHLWDRSRSPYEWLRPELGVLTESHRPGDIAGTLADLGIAGAVLVQADDTVADTEAMVEMAATTEWLAGVVGWVQLDDPSIAGGQLERWADIPVVKGIRHLVHDDPRSVFLELPSVQQSLGLVARHGLRLDIPDAWPGGFADQIAPLADRHPELLIIVDHLAKPPHGGDDFTAWTTMMAELAGRPNVLVKLSGLADHRDQGPGAEVGAAVSRWRPAVEVALETFGPDRMMYGSDWPITRLGLDYRGTWDAIRMLIGQLSDDERAAILGGTAARCYRLGID